MNISLPPLESSPTASRPARSLFTGKLDLATSLFFHQPSRMPVSSLRSVPWRGHLTPVTSPEANRWGVLEDLGLYRHSLSSLKVAQQHAGLLNAFKFPSGNMDLLDCARILLKHIQFLLITLLRLALLDNFTPLADRILDDSLHPPIPILDRSDQSIDPNDNHCRLQIRYS